MDDVSFLRVFLEIDNDFDGMQELHGVFSDEELSLEQARHKLVLQIKELGKKCDKCKIYFCGCP